MNKVLKKIIFGIIISITFASGFVSSYKFHNMFIMKQCLKAELKLIENCNRWYEGLQR